MARIKRFYKQIFSRGINLFLVILTVAFALTSCTHSEQIPPDPECVFDDLGRLVCFNETPERIVSLAPSNTEILFALGLGDKVVRRTDYCNYPEEVLEIESIGGYSTPDVESIVASHTDLVLAGYGNPEDVVYTLEGLGLTVFGIKTTDLDDLLNDIRTIGEITDKEVEAQSITFEMALGIQAVTNQTEELEQRPSVFYLLDTWGGLWTAGSDTFIHELIEAAGGVNICQNLTGYTPVSIEHVLFSDPEIIITSVWSYDWALNATELASTNASQTGRIYTCDDDLVHRPGPRLVKGLEWFAYFIHPEIFDEPED